MRQQAADYRENPEPWPNMMMMENILTAQMADEGPLLRQATIHHGLVPVLCGSSYRNKGVQPLLDAVVRFLPSPVDVGAVKGYHPQSGQEDFRLPADEAPFCALVFKIMVDPFVGKLAFIRVYSGQLKSGGVR